MARGRETVSQRFAEMLLIFAIVLVAIWVLGLVAFEVRSASIHLLLLVAALAAGAHIMRRRARPLE